MSIDCPNAQMPKNSSGGDDFNYIDTYVEFIAEVVLKYDNAIPETQNRQQKEWQFQKQFVVVCQEIQPVAVSFYSGEIKKSFIHPSDRNSLQYIGEINPPPPKHC